jgi:hypothetical protein
MDAKLARLHRECSGIPKLFFGVQSNPKKLVDDILEWFARATHLGVQLHGDIVIQS